MKIFYTIENHKSKGKNGSMEASPNPGERLGRRLLICQRRLHIFHIILTPCSPPAESGGHKEGVFGKEAKGGWLRNPDESRAGQAFFFRGNRAKDAATMRRFSLTARLLREAGSEEADRRRCLSGRRSPSNQGRPRVLSRRKRRNGQA